jgi:hypothetical protein
MARNMQIILSTQTKRNPKELGKMIKMQGKTIHQATNPKTKIQKEPRQKLQHFKLLKANSIGVKPRTLHYKITN